MPEEDLISSDSITNLSENLLNLFKAQRQYLEKAEKDLDKNNGVKTEHWIWYVFPTKRPGDSDFKKVFINKDQHKQYIDYLNKNHSYLLDKWTNIINKLKKVLNEKDYRRIEFFILEWQNSQLIEVFKNAINNLIEKKETLLPVG